jgi:mono/diheme cytochrome c family protein
VSADDSKAKVRTVTYSQDIRPLLEKHCVECHSGWFPDGGLRLDTIDAIFKGGNSGPVIVPGSPDKGWLMYSLTTAGQRRMQMPPNGERLSQQQVNLIKEWIKHGAK